MSKPIGFWIWLFQRVKEELVSALSFPWRHRVGFEFVVGLGFIISSFAITVLYSSPVPLIITALGVLLILHAYYLDMVV